MRARDLRLEDFTDVVYSAGLATSSFQKLGVTRDKIGNYLRTGLYENDPGPDRPESAVKLMDDLRLLRTMALITITAVQGHELSAGGNTGSRRGFKRLQPRRDPYTTLPDAEFLARLNNAYQDNAPSSSLRADIKGKPTLLIRTHYGNYEAPVITRKELDNLIAGITAPEFSNPDAESVQATSLFVALAKTQPFMKNNELTALFAANALLLSKSLQRGPDPVFLTLPTESSPFYLPEPTDPAGPRTETPTKYQAINEFRDLLDRVYMQDNPAIPHKNAFPEEALTAYMARNNTVTLNGNKLEQERRTSASRELGAVSPENLLLVTLTSNLTADEAYAVKSEFDALAFGPDDATSGLTAIENRESRLLMLIVNRISDKGLNQAIAQYEDLEPYNQSMTEDQKRIFEYRYLGLYGENLSWLNSERDKRIAHDITPEGEKYPRYVMPHDRAAWINRVHSDSLDTTPVQHESDTAMTNPVPLNDWAAIWLTQPELLHDLTRQISITGLVTVIHDYEAMPGHDPDLLRNLKEVNKARTDPDQNPELNERPPTKTPIPQSNPERRAWLQQLSAQADALGSLETLTTLLAHTMVPKTLNAMINKHEAQSAHDDRDDPLLTILKDEYQTWLDNFYDTKTGIVTPVKPTAIPAPKAAPAPNLSETYNYQHLGKPAGTEPGLSL